ncbi:MAG: hypothetical protein GTO30_22400 [Acidobacteria bacterium]|nr:hypothetical protein [Acidobacteriota bacterium]NIM64302.1 hypothetical protein [Acidobacteriota bacterium]NIO60934.1 hypothetical protein [Acidobacteriota bacterium]NIQ87403.1 hypothetical protein [Acidobacteriota bacterium]NIT12588.1 hypothetical protein [Acidobacteriota bacterium]
MRHILISAALLATMGAATSAHDGDAASDADQPTRPELDIGGFIDLNYYASDESRADSSSGFDEGQFVLHFVSVLSKRINFFGEVSLSGTDSEFKTELERAIVKFEASDYYRFSVGRFHTPINWWNTAFHHGQWLQTTVSRPEMTRFGGQFIPVHYVGAIVDGAIPSGAAGLRYAAGVGNGRGENIARGGDDGDVNNNRATFLKVAAKPDRAYGLEVGASLYRDKITVSTLPEEYDEDLVSAYVVWNREDPEIIAEYATIDRKGATTGTEFDHDAWYVQFAYRLPFWGSKLKPYARFEEIDVDLADPVFTAQPNREGYLAGVRIDVSVFAAIKLEYRHQRTNQDPYVDSAYAQVAIAF